MNELLLKVAAPILNGVVDELLKQENIQVYGDRLFDFLEDAVTNSETTIDDVTVLPIIAALRKAFDIPDND